MTKICDFCEKSDIFAKKVKKHDMCEKSLLKPVRAVFLK
jgi:hypothetical protein